MKWIEAIKENKKARAAIATAAATMAIAAYMASPAVPCAYGMQDAQGIDHATHQQIIAGADMAGDGNKNLA